VGFSLTLMPGVSHARLSGVVAAPGVAGAAWLIALGLIGVACLAALSLLLVHGDASARRRQRAMRTRLNKIDLPAAISGIDGKVEASNPAMRAAFGDTPGDIAQMLGRGIEVDAGQIYRLATRSREIGFAYEPVRSLQDDSTVVLSARFDEPKRLVWTVFSPERLPRIEQDRMAGSYEGAPFAHMRIDENGNTSTNPRFRETFDGLSDLPTESLHEEPSQGIRRALLQRRDGGTQLSNIITVPAACADPGARDIFIFPVHERAEIPGATSTLDAVPVALMRFDFKGRMLWCNVAAREMLGREFQPGAALAEMIEPLGRPVDALIADCIANEKGRREMVRLRGGALETFLQISLTAVTLDDDPSLLAVLSDASELRLLEDKFTQSQKMEAVGKLARAAWRMISTMS
jgi:PAS domain-containing protein